jgi:K+/H+ antiporter YhaU regulatory subunit KhtT
MGAALLELEEEIESLLQERKAMEARLEEAIVKVLHYTSGTIATMRHVEEVMIPPESSLVGQTLQSADLRSRTGATVIGIARQGEEIFSPDPSMPIQSGDLLIVVGSGEAKERLRGAVGARPRGGEPA